ncbi:unnamed protein product, partial [Symbiodinium pilosum]
MRHDEATSCMESSVEVTCGVRYIYLALGCLLCLLMSYCGAMLSKEDVHDEQSWYCGDSAYRRYELGWMVLNMLGIFMTPDVQTASMEAPAEDDGVVREIVEEALHCERDPVPKDSGSAPLRIFFLDDSDDDDEDSAQDIQQSEVDWYNMEKDQGSAPFQVFLLDDSDDEDEEVEQSE